MGALYTYSFLGGRYRVWWKMYVMCMNIYALYFMQHVVYEVCVLCALWDVCMWYIVTKWCVYSVLWCVKCVCVFSSCVCVYIMYGLFCGGLYVGCVSGVYPILWDMWYVCV